MRQNFARANLTQPTHHLLLIAQAESIDVTNALVHSVISTFKMPSQQLATTEFTSIVPTRWNGSHDSSVSFSPLKSGESCPVQNEAVFPLRIYQPSPV